MRWVGNWKCETNSNGCGEEKDEKFSSGPNLLLERWKQGGERLKLETYGINDSFLENCEQSAMKLYFEVVQYLK